MKSFTKFVIAAILIGVSAGANGQHNYANTGSNRYNYFSHKINREIRFYPDYHLVSTKRIHKNHRILVVVTLRKRNRFVEITMNHHGRVVAKRHYHFRPERPVYHSYGYSYSGWSNGYDNWSTASNRYRRSPEVHRRSREVVWNGPSRDRHN